MMKSGTQSVSRQRNVPVAQRKLRRQHVREQFLRPSAPPDRRDNWALSLGGPVGIPKLKTFKDVVLVYAPTKSTTRASAAVEPDRHDASTRTGTRAI